MSLLRLVLVLCFVTVVLPPGSAAALDFEKLFGSSPWGLPVSLSEQNTTIRYEVDATIHTVKGTVDKLTGRAWLLSDSDPRSVQVEVSFAIADMSSGNDSRDTRMRKAMHADTQPVVRLRLAAKELCLPASITPQGSCSGSLGGELSISGVSLPVTAPVTVRNSPDSLVVQGSTTVSWKAFSIEDPSTLLASVQDPVHITYEVRLR